MADTGPSPLADGIRTTRLLERAVRERWPVADQYRQAIMDRQVRIAIDPDSSPREATSAARTVISADRVNLEDEKKDDPQQHLHIHQNEQVLNVHELTVTELADLLASLGPPEEESKGTGVSLDALEGFTRPPVAGVGQPG